MLLQNLPEFANLDIVGCERSDQRLLVLVDPPGVGFLHFQFRVWRDSCLCHSVDEVPMKRIRFLVMNRHTDIIKLDDPVQFPY